MSLKYFNQQYEGKIVDLPELTISKNLLLSHKNWLKFKFLSKELIKSAWNDFIENKPLTVVYSIILLRLCIFIYLRKSKFNLIPS